jgi:glycerol-3-phosphate cytidylyltransferase-like family protein
MMTNFNNIEFDKLPVGYRKTYRLLQKSGMTNGLIRGFQNELSKWFVDIANIPEPKKVTNPTTNRDIKYTPNRPSTYKKIFKAIKLKDVIDNNLTIYNTIDYKIDKYCVPSYLSKLLTKKQYSKIEDDLNKNNTPTYPELTEMLNKVNYGLQVRIIDNEIIQETDKKKKIKILIHNSHMYVLTNTKQLIKHKTVKLNNDDFDIKKKELEDCHNLNYSDYEIYDKENKYIVDEPIYNEIKKKYDWFSTYNLENVDFYHDCNIRSPKYCNTNIKNRGTIDVVNCYKNIMYNEDYIFAIQNGEEIITHYKSTDKIERHGFYFCEFKKMDIADKAIFNKKCWMYGDVLIKTGIFEKVDILYKHIPYTCTTTKKSNYKSKNMSIFSGMLAKFETYTTTKYDISDNDEKIAIRKKYGSNCSFSNKSVCIDKRRYKKKSGLYSYLSILSYNRLQMWTLVKTLLTFKKYKKMRIRKIYTDSISIDKFIDENDIIKINKKLEKFKFSVHEEESNYTFKTNYGSCKYSNGITLIQKPNYFKREDILKLVKKNKSFGLYGRGGYGKT